mmetsp:Transcript_109396/g.304366  ORF Transcript_109396/g.304366 Transcript_109396/m.304366 type:complete len:452 (+) Transcript_109396:1-1356(+)
MEKELFSAQEKWRAQIRKAEQATEQARREGEARLKPAQERADALASETARLEAILQEAAKLENRLRSENTDMEKELHKAQDQWKKRIQVAEQAAKEAEAERKRLADELAGLREQSGKRAADEGELRRHLQEDLDTLRRDRDSRMEELRAAAEVEAQLRRAVEEGDRQRLQLEERANDLTSQLDTSQAAYTEAVREVSSMAARLDELEFATHAKAGTDDLVQDELSAARERQTELERQLKEAAWMRDYALQQAEEARAQAQRLREGAAEAQEAAAAAAPGGSVTRSDDASSAAGGAAAASPERLAEVEAALQSLRAEHTEELQRLAVMHRDEVDFLRKKGEEKDRRLETLLCERNALRLETKEPRPAVVAPVKPKAPAESLDLEEGLPASGDAAASGGSVFVQEGDLLLRRFSRILFMSRTMRGAFYGYLLMLHIWIWVILHHTASSRTSAS